jgi:hypothetical protein
MTGPIKLTIGLTVVMLLPSFCGKKYPDEANQALAALQKVQAATQVGVTYQEYGHLVIEARDKVNAADRVLTDSTLNKEFDAATDAYTDANTAWGQKVQGYDLYPNIRPGSTLIPKYNLQTKYDVADASRAIQIIWLEADAHLQQATNLMNGTK